MPATPTHSFASADCSVRAPSRSQKDWRNRGMGNRSSSSSTVLASKKDYRRAAGRAKEVVGSASIGVCANAGCFEFVEEWEGGKVEFDPYAGKLAAFLEPKGVLDAPQFKRMLTAVYNFGMNWNGAASQFEQALAARASIAGGGWCLLTAVSIREMLGAAPRFSSSDYAKIIDRIV